MIFDFSRLRLPTDFINRAQRDLPDGYFTTHAVSIEDENTGAPLTINPDGSINVNGGGGGGGINPKYLGSTSQIYPGKQTVAPVTETLLVQYLNAGSVFLLKGWSGTGQDDGYFRLYINGVQVWEGKNAWTQRTVEAHLEQAVAIGVLIELKVYNPRAVNVDYSGAFYGYQL